MLNTYLIYFKGVPFERVGQEWSGKGAILSIYCAAWMGNGLNDVHFSPPSPH